MTDQQQETQWTLLDDADAAAQHTTERILSAARRAIDDHGDFRLVLAGGGTPMQAYRRLAQSQADWGRWRLYYGDERCLPVGDPQRNSYACETVWLDRAVCSAARHFPIPAEAGAEAAAAIYAETLRGVPPFDLVLLGMGEDGHTASLFPGHVDPGDTAVLPVHQAPKPPPDRVSLSFRTLSDAQDVLILITGAGKRQALARWRAGEDLPVTRIRAHRRLEVLMDRAALGMDPF